MDTITNVETSNIPIIDLARSHDNQSEIIKALGDGLREFGFVAIKNHGIDLGLISKNYELLERVFSLDEKTKQKYARPEIGFQRGYLPLNGETHPNAKSKDIKECWQTVNCPSDTRFNIFPEEVKEFGMINTFLYSDMEKVAVRLIGLLDIYLGADNLLNSLVLEDTDSGQVYTGDHLLRNIRYPSVSNPQFNEEGFIIRGDSHVDLNLITLLPAASCLGLQIKKRDGEWLTIHSSEEFLILNAADMLMYITKGTDKEIPSTVHRVIADQDLIKRDRFSVPFFCHPDHSKPLVNLQTKESIVLPNGLVLDEAGKYVWWRLSNILPAGTVPSYDEWKINQSR